MQKPLLYTSALAAALLLTGCASSTSNGSKLISFPGAYKIDIQQGNVITQKMIDQLKPGMTKSQVQYVMGTPLLEDAFNRNRWDYVYSMQAGGGKRSQKTLTLLFENDRLAAIRGDLKPDSKSKP